jgi:hypothetical protein
MCEAGIHASDLRRADGRRRSPEDERINIWITNDDRDPNISIRPPNFDRDYWRSHVGLKIIPRIKLSGTLHEVFFISIVRFLD